MVSTPGYILNQRQMKTGEKCGDGEEQRPVAFDTSVNSTRRSAKF